MKDAKKILLKKITMYVKAKHHPANCDDETQNVYRGILNALEDAYIEIGGDRETVRLLIYGRK